MSDRPSHNLGGLDIELACRIDEICRRFEAGCRDGRRPRIEDYLGEVPDEGRPALRAELIALERELCPSDEMVARREAGPPTAPEPQTAPSPSTIAQAPTIAPGPPPTSPIPDTACPAVHEQATLPPNNPPQSPHDQPTVAVLGQDSSATLGAADTTRIRYFGDYEIVREIARGGMGVVFQARQASLNRPVALKMILAGQLANDTDVKRFYTEAEAAANLDHPGIVPIFEVGQHEGQLYFSMGFVEGQSLSQRVAGGPLPAREAAELIRRVSQAIEYAHQRGVIHRDLKPANILLDQNGNPRVTDFGLAKKIQGDSGLTGSGQIMGTPSYMPPEQAGGPRREVGPAADVYALGATLYALVTGRPPFQAATAMDTVLQVISDEPVPPRRLNASVPLDLETICLKCLEKEPGKRYASASNLTDDLGRYLAGEPILARRVTAWERAVKWARRKPAIAAMGLAIALLAVGGMTGILVQWRRAEVQRDRAERIAAETALGRGLALAEVGDAARGLLWMARALKMAPPGDESLSHVIRSNLSAWREHVIPLKDVVRVPEAYEVHVLSPDGRTVLTAGSWSKDLSPGSNATSRIFSSATATLSSAIDGTQIGTLLTHDAAIRLGVFSPEGKACLTESQDGTARLWSAKDGMPIGPPLKTHAGGKVEPNNIAAVAFSRDRTTLLIARDKTARFWDAAAGRPLGVEMTHDGAIRAAAFSPDGRVALTGGGDKAARLWSVPDGRPLGARMPHGGPVGALAFSPDGTAILTGSDDNTARRWRRDDGTPIGTPLAHGGPVRAVAFNPGGTTIATGSEDGTARLWNAADGTPVNRPLDHSAGVRQVAFSASGSVLLTRSDSEVKVWRAADGMPIGQPPIAGRLGAALDPDGKTAVLFDGEVDEIMNSAREIEIRRWSVGDEPPIARPTLEKSHQSRAWAFNPDGRSVLLAFKTAQLWSLTGGSPIGRPFSHPNQSINAVAFSPDGGMLATASHDATARLWDPAKGTPIGKPLVHPATVYKVAFSPDGRTVATLCGDGEARLWNAATGAPIGPPLKQRGGNGRALERVLEVLFRPDGKAVMTLSYFVNNYFVQLWNTSDGTPMGSPIMPRSQSATISVATFSPEGWTLLTMSVQGLTRLWSAVDGSPIGRPMVLQAEGSELPSDSNSPLVAFRPDGRAVLTASKDGAARLWAVRDGTPIGKPMIHRGPVNVVAFSPDGRTILTGGSDGTVRRWGAADGIPIGTPLNHGEPVADIAFSPGGHFVASHGETTLRVWEVPPAVPGDVRRIELWVQVLTGLELDESDLIRAISPRPRHGGKKALLEDELGRGAYVVIKYRKDDGSWAYRRQLLEELGGPPVP